MGSPCSPRLAHGGRPTEDGRENSKRPFGSGRHERMQRCTFSSPHPRLRNPSGGAAPADPPPHPHQKIFLRQKKKFRKGPRNLRPVLGTQTFFWPLTHPLTGGGGLLKQSPDPPPLRKQHQSPKM